MAAYLGLILAVAATPLQQVQSTDYIALPPPIGKPCAASDLVGVWSSDLLGRAVDPNTAPPVLATDYVRIKPDGAMTYFSTPRRPSSLAEVERGLNKVDEAVDLKMKAEITRPGVLIITRNGAPAEGFTCTLIRNTDSAGEILWTQLKGRPPVFRHNLRLRR